jgi:hypothetical protein
MGDLGSHSVALFDLPKCVFRPVGSNRKERRLCAAEKFPAHYAIPAHSHPADENVVVVSDALTFGMGDKLMRDAGHNKTLTPGGFVLMPAAMNHYAFTNA